MKNISVSVDDETYHLARVRATELETSVSALVHNYLRNLVEASKDSVESDCDDQMFSKKWGKTFDSEAEFQEHIKNLHKTIDKIRKKHPEIRVSDNLSREELYDRTLTMPSFFSLDKRSRNDDP